MNVASARRRAVEAMGLGPVWVRRRSVVDEPPAEAPLDRAARIALLDWDSLRDVVAPCTACDLCRTRTQTVFGVGAERPECLVVGEAPGADEDAQGEPFVGKAGKLLDAMLASVGFSRQTNVFIANMLKCRPPGNRDPLPFEIEQCRPYLERQVALLAPKMVLVVGKVATHALLRTDASMSSLRQKEHRLEVAGRTIPLVVTYHPAYLLRSPDEKVKAWADLCFAREIHERLASRP